MAVVRGHREPCFDIVYTAVDAASQMGLAVCIICLSVPVLQQWWDRFPNLPRRLVFVDLTSTSRLTFDNSKAILSYREFDMVVFHGAMHEVRHHGLSSRYVARLIASVSKGLIVLA